MKKYICIITKNNPCKLNLILDSIVNNKTFDNSDIIVIDDSSLDESIVKNKEIIEKVDDKLNILYLGKSKWKIIKNYIIKILGDYKLIIDINLGLDNRNTHNVRNISLIIGALLYDNSYYSLNFDDDMILDQFDFGLDLSEKIYGMRLCGCPDLSRYEWIQLFIRKVILSLNMDFGLDDDFYVNELINNLGLDEIDSLLYHYTDLKCDEIKYKTKIIGFPKRSELSGGFYVSNVSNNKYCFFPNIYNEDWYWLYKIREIRKIKLQFIDNRVIHNSSIKNVLDLEGLLFEEEGEFVEMFFRDEDLKNLLGNEFLLFKSSREKRIKYELSLIDMVEKNGNIDEKTKHTLSIIKENLIKLINYINKEEFKEDLNNKMICIYNEDKDWENIIDEISKITIPKEILFSKQLVVISPHIDDAYLGLGGFISSKFNNVSIFNVFSRTNYRIDGLDKIEDVTEIRKKEEININKITGAKSYFMDYDDAILRLGFDEEDYILDDYLEADIFDIIFKKIKKLIDSNKSAIYFFPLGIGGHVDHYLLFNIGVKLHDLGYNVYFYEDLGYEEIMDKKQLIKRFDSIGKTCKSFVIPIESLEKKCDIIKLYHSQYEEEYDIILKKIYDMHNGEIVFKLS